MIKPGSVTLVGAGPGDPELITLRGARALAEADVVLYDRLAGVEMLQHARPGAELISVGKRCGDHSVPQDEINRRLVEFARSGKRVVRLKNGDPFVFGRGGEEADELAAAGIPVEIVPGVTAAVAAGAATGIPLTLRGVSSCVTLVTGHEDPTKEHSDVDWASLAASGSTLVIYMAMANLEKLVTRLLDAGLAGTTPAAVVCRATRPDQRRITARLEELHKRVTEEQLTPPSVVIIGGVVSLEEA